MAATADGEVMNAAQGLREVAERILNDVETVVLPNDLAAAIHRMARSVGPLIRATPDGDRIPSELIGEHAIVVAAKLEPILGHVSSGKLEPHVLARAKRDLAGAIDEFSKAIDLGRA